MHKWIDTIEYGLHTYPMRWRRFNVHNLMANLIVNPRPGPITRLQLAGSSIPFWMFLILGF